MNTRQQAKPQTEVVLTLGRIVVTNALHGVADDLLVIKNGGGSDLTENHDHTSLGASFCKSLSVWNKTLFD